MNKSIFYVLLSALIGLGIAQTAIAERLIISGIAPGLNDSNQQAVLELAKKLCVECDAGDTVQFYDLGTRQRIFSKIIPKADSPRGRLILCRTELATLTAHLKAPPPQGRHANVPAFLTGLRLDGKPARVILITSLFHGDDRDVGATFVPGQCPSDAHPLASSRESIYGASDRKDSLTGVGIDWVNLDETASTLELRAVSRFWSVWAKELGATLTSVESTATAAAENALKGLSAPLTTESIDRTDTVMEIRSLSKPAPSPALDKPVMHEVDLVVAQDGSGSMLPAIESTKKLMSMTAELGARLTPRFALGAVVYRNTAGFSMFSPTRIERTPAGSVESAGMVSLRGFQEDATFDARVVEGASGDDASRKSGAGKMVSQMTPLASHVDFEGGVRASLAMLEQGNPKARKVLMIVGDMGTSESDGAAGTSAEDAAAAERTIEMTRAFAQRYPDTRILAVYCGGLTTPDRAETIDLFRRLAAVAGEHGVFTEDMAVMEPLVTQAMLKP